MHKGLLFILLGLFGAPVVVTVLVGFLGVPNQGFVKIIPFIGALLIFLGILMLVLRIGKPKRGPGSGKL
jgi:hypothetical protein